MREAVRAAIELCRELGAEVEECSLPRVGRVRAAVLLPDRARRRRPRTSPATTASATATAPADGGDRLEIYERTRDEGFGDEPKRRIMLGTYALSAGYYDAYYGQAQKVRTMITREHAEVFERFDVLVSPTSPTVAFPIGERTADPLAMYLSDLLTIPSCMAGLPGLTSRAGSPRGCRSGCS